MQSLKKIVNGSGTIVISDFEIFPPFFRSSSASAAVAFAVATAGSGNPPDLGPPNRRGENFRDQAKRKCSITSNVSTLRVLSVLRHWVTKHSQVTFEIKSCSLIV